MRQTSLRFLFPPPRTFMGLAPARLITWVAVAGLLGTGTAGGQQPAAGRATITGVVRDAQVGTPIPSAVVSIPGTSYQALTDSAGRYSLRGVPMGNQTIDA